MDEDKKMKYQIDLFQTARVHTEQFVEEFDSEEAAREYIENLCKEKGVEADYELTLVPEPEEVTPVGADEAVSEDSEGESENSPEGSDEKTTQNNSLPVN